MEQIKSLWTSMDPRKRLMVGIATVAMFAAVLGVARMAATPSMVLLYSGLEPAAAGEIVAALDAQGAVYEVRGAAIYVDSTRRDALRMTLAGDGLPANGSQGYELLEALTGFGTTSQMFDAAYWRAKEGELARTIVTARHVRSARVHIATPSNRPFGRDDTLTASVTVTTASGTLSVPSAKALKYLVASAVAGLEPEQVSIIDASGGLIAAGPDILGGSGVAHQDRAITLQRNAERLLEARVGYGNAIVEVAVETVTEREQITERTFDPDTRFAISTDSEERVTSANDARSGAVTVASNLPDGDAGDIGRSSNSTATETRERVNYEVSQTHREITRMPGDIKRMSVAILVDGIRGTDPSGAPRWEPRSEAELEDLRELIASALGVTAERGDVITIRSLEFEPTVEAGTTATPAFTERLGIDIMQLTQMGVLAVIALILGLFVLRPILASRTLPAPSQPGMITDGVSPSLLQLPSLDGEIENGPDVPRELPMLPARSGSAQDGGLPALVQPADDPVERLRRMIDDRQEETVELLKGWMEDAEPSA